MKKHAHYKISYAVSLYAFIVDLLFTFFVTCLTVKLIGLATDGTFL